MKFLLWWAGLRGAVAYSLALSVPFGRRPDDPIPEFCDINICSQNLSYFNLSQVNQTLQQEFHYRRCWEATVTTTISVIFLTLFGFGATTAGLLKLLKLSGDEIQPKGKFLKRVTLHPTWVESRLLAFDRTFIIPLISSTEKRRYYYKIDPQTGYAVPDTSTRITFDAKRDVAEEMLTTETLIQNKSSLELQRISVELQRVSFELHRATREKNKNGDTDDTTVVVESENTTRATSTNDRSDVVDDGVSVQAQDLAQTSLIPRVSSDEDESSSS